MAVLIVNIDYVGEVYERAWNGEIIDGDKAQTINFVVTNELSHNNQSLQFKFVLRVPKDKTSTSDNEKIKCLAWSHTVFPKLFESRSHWDFFKHEWLDYTKCQAENVSEYFSEHTVNLNSSMLNIFTAAAEHVSIVRKVFDPAKDRLQTLAFNCSPSEFNYYHGEAYQLFSKLEKILQCSDSIGGYNYTDIRSAMGDYAELSRRKKENNHNYQVALSSLRSVVSGIGFPRSWYKKPEVIE